MPMLSGGCEVKEKMLEAGLSSTVNYLDLLDDTTCALAAIHALIKNQRGRGVEAEHIAPLLDIIGDNLEECVTAWMIERKHSGVRNA